MVKLQEVIILTLADFIKFFDLNEFWKKREEFLQLFINEIKRVKLARELACDAEPYSFVSSLDEYLLLHLLVEWLRNPERDLESYMYGLTIDETVISIEKGTYMFITGKKVDKDVCIGLGRLADYYLNARIKKEHKVGLTLLYQFLKANEPNSEIPVKYEIPIDTSKVEELDEDRIFNHGYDFPLYGKVLRYKGIGTIRVGVEDTVEVIDLKYGECITGLFTALGGCKQLIKCDNKNKYLKFKLKINKDGISRLEMKKECVSDIRNNEDNNDEDALKAKNLLAHITTKDEDIFFDDVLSYTVEDDKMAIVFFDGEIRTYNWYSLLWNIDTYKMRFEKDFGKILSIKDEHTFIVEKKIFDIS